MDFNNLFKTFTNNESSQERVDTINNFEAIDASVHNKINAIRNSDSDDLIENEITDNSAEESAPEAQSLNPSILDALSGLDTMDTSIVSDIQKNDEPITEEEIEKPIIEDSLENPDPNEKLDFNDDFLQSLNDQSIEEDLLSNVSLEQDAPQEFEEESNFSNEPVDLQDNDEFEIDSFLQNFDDNNNTDVDNFQDFDDNFTAEFEESSSIAQFEDDNDEFTIENPDSLYEETIEDLSFNQENEKISSPNDNIELDTFPDFDQIDTSDVKQDLSPNISTEELQATDFEVVSSSPDLNSWSSTKQNNVPEIAPEIQLSDSQIHAIRRRINNIKNRELRFQIRDIFIDPDSYVDIYQELLSLLLIDADEDTLAEFVQLNTDSPDIEINEKIDAGYDFHPSFSADDYAQYQERINNIRENFQQNLRNFGLYGSMSILGLIILWFGLIVPFQINNIYERGLTAIREDRFIQGESIFQQATAQSDQVFEEWYIKYADVYEQKGLLAEAENKYTALLTRDPANIIGAIKASEFYSSLGGIYYTNALDILKNTSSFHLRNFEIWDFYGKTYIHLSDSETNSLTNQRQALYDAANVYREFILNNPKNIAPYYRMMDLYIRIGTPDQIDRIAQAIDKLNPKFINLEIIARLLSYYIDRRDLNSAEPIISRIAPFLDKYIQDLPTLQNKMDELYNISPTIFSNVLSQNYYENARYNLLSGNITQAASLLTNALIFDPTNAQNYNLLGEIFLSQTDPRAYLSQAQTAFETALEFDDMYYKAHINLGHIYYYWDTTFNNSSQTLSRALYEYQLAKNLMPVNVINYLLNYNMGWLQNNSDQSRDALETWSDIYKETPNDPVLSYAMASALYKADNPQLSLSEFEKTALIFENLRKNVPVPNLNNKRHREIYLQLARSYNNIGVINANYALANPSLRDTFEAQALLNFYKAQDIADQINYIYSEAEFNIGVLTRPNIRNRRTEFDNTVPKNSSIENEAIVFRQNLLKQI